LLALLHTELPWATTVSAQPADTAATAADLDPVLAQTGRLDQDLLSSEMREALRRRDRIRAVNIASHQRHLTASRIRERQRDTGIDI
jgi:hypothetical protein